MASYSLLASVSTVQVLSPTIVNDVVYCTIQTQPSNVVASIPISQAAAGSAAGSSVVNLQPPILVAFADNIETIIGRGNIIAGTGVQTIDPNGLLQDFVSFTVQYVPPNTNTTAITAEALVPVGLLSSDDSAINQTLLAEAEKIVTDTYDALKAAATG